MGIFDAHGQREVALPIAEAWARLLRVLADTDLGATLETLDEEHHLIRARLGGAMWGTGVHLEASVARVDDQHSLILVVGRQRWYGWSLPSAIRQHRVVPEILGAAAGVAPSPVVPRTNRRARWPWLLIGAGLASAAIAAGMVYRDRPVPPRVSLDPDRGYILAHAALPVVTDVPGAGWTVAAVDDFFDADALPSRACTEVAVRTQRTRQTLDAANSARAEIAFTQEHPSFDTPRVDVRIYILRDLASGDRVLSALRDEIAGHVPEDCLRERLIDAHFTDVVSSIRIPSGGVPQRGMAVAYRVEGLLEGSAYTIAFERYAVIVDNAVVLMQISGEPRSASVLSGPLLSAARSGVSRAAAIKDPAPRTALAAWGRSFCGYVDATHAPTAPDVSKMQAWQVRNAYAEYLRAQADRQSTQLSQLVALPPPANAERFHEKYVAALATQRLDSEAALYDVAAARRVDELQEAASAFGDRRESARRAIVDAFREAPPEVAGIAQCLDGPVETAAWGAAVCVANASLLEITRADLRTSPLLDGRGKAGPALTTYVASMRGAQTALRAQRPPPAGAALHDAMDTVLGRTTERATRAIGEIDRAVLDEEVAATLSTLGKGLAADLDPVARAVDSTSPEVKRALAMCN